MRGRERVYNATSQNCVTKYNIMSHVSGLRRVNRVSKRNIRRTLRIFEKQKKKDCVMPIYLFAVNGVRLFHQTNLFANEILQRIKIEE